MLQQSEQAFEQLAEKCRELESAKIRLERDVAERDQTELTLIKYQRQLGILLYANQQLNSVLDPQVVLQTLIRSAVELAGASGGSAGLLNDSKMVISQCLFKGEFIPVSYSFAPGEGAAGQVLQAQEVSIANAPLLYHFSEDMDERFTLRNLINVPIINQTGELLGCFEIYNTLNGRPFDSNDATILQGLAAGAAVALENSRMLAELLEAKQASDAACSLLSATIESTIDGIMAIDLNGEITAFNRRFVEMWEIADEVLASGDSNNVLFTVLEKVKNPVGYFEKVTELYWQSEAESYDLIELMDGRFFERISKPQRNEAKVVGRVWTYHDVTELKRLENQLLHSQKMEAIGTLAGGIAHDFNNIMTAVINYTSLLQVKLNPVAPYSDYLARILTASDRAVALIRSLLAYSRKESIKTSVMECNSLVQQLMDFVARLIGEDIELTIDLSAEPLAILVDGGQIEQVIVNLATNARDAMPLGGKLGLSVTRADLSVDFIQPYAEGTPGPYVVIAVSDTGSGMDEETRQRIFEPFFTTKDVGKGTGLGLSISYGIVKQHGGFITVDSALGRGTTFSVFLPLANTDPDEQHIPAALSVPTGNETVLLIEDDEAVRSLINSVLTAQGYRVIEAVDGEDGIRLFRVLGNSIQLVILDVIMPKKNGCEAYNEIRTIRRDVPAIFISGYTGEIIDRQGIHENSLNFLMKPFRPEQLLCLVRQVIDQTIPAPPEQTLALLSA